jgi:hypothetical protein
MPQNLRGSLLQPTRLLIGGRLSDRVAEGLRKASDDGDIVFGEVVQLDRLDNAIVVLRVLCSTRENFLVVLVGISKVEEACALFDDTSLVILGIKKKKIGKKPTKTLTNLLPSDLIPPTNSSQAGPPFASTMIRLVNSHAISTCSLPIPLPWSEERGMQYTYCRASFASILTN